VALRDDGVRAALPSRFAPRFAGIALDAGAVRVGDEETPPLEERSRPPEAPPLEDGSSAARVAYSRAAAMTETPVAVAIGAREGESARARNTPAAEQRRTAVAAMRPDAAVHGGADDGMAVARAAPKGAEGAMRRASASRDVSGSVPPAPSPLPLPLLREPAVAQGRARARAAQPAVVHVTIDRIDVRAPAAPPSPKGAGKRAVPPAGALADYLTQRQRASTRGV
jgi:hypothetical protein